MACVKVLLGESPGKMEPIKPRRECLETIEQVIRVQSKHWKSLVPEYNDVNQGNFVIFIISLKII